MKMPKMTRFFSAVCVAVLLVTMLQGVTFAADDDVVDLGTVRAGDEVDWERVTGSNGTVTIRVSGNAPINETRARTSANPSKPYADIIYDFDELPQEWVIPIRRSGTTTGYYVVLPAKGTTNFRISGTQFSTVQVMEEITYGDPIALTEGKYKYVYNEHAIKLTLR